MAKDKEEKDEKDEGEDLVIVTKHADDVETPPTGAEEIEDETPPRRKPQEEEDEDEEEEEEARLGASEEDNEDKPSKKATHKTRRQRQKEAQQRLERERDFLEKRNEELERRLSETAKQTDERLGAVEKSQVDQRIAYAKGIIKKAEAVMAEATSKGRGEENVEATRIRDEWRDHLKELSEHRAAMDEEPEKVNEPPPANPRVVKMAKDWYEAHPWYDFGEGNRDSKIVGILDKEIASEGYDPTTKEYWDELSKRVQEALPHRAGKKKAGRKSNGHDEEDEEDEDQLEAAGEDEEEERPKPKPKKKGKGGPMFRTGGPGRDLKDNEVFLTRDRIAALKELGAWDDPKLRAKYLKKYQDWDREHAND